MSTVKVPKQESMSEQISKKTGLPEPSYNNTGTATLEKVGYLLSFLIDLFKFFVIGAIRTFPMATMFILGFIIYTILIGYLFLKNPLDWINENNGGGTRIKLHVSCLKTHLSQPHLICQDTIHSILLQPNHPIQSF